MKAAHSERDILTGNSLAGGTHVALYSGHAIDG